MGALSNVRSRHSHSIFGCRNRLSLVGCNNESPVYQYCSSSNASLQLRPHSFALWGECFHGYNNVILPIELDAMPIMTRDALEESLKGRLWVERPMYPRLLFILTPVLDRHSYAIPNQGHSQWKPTNWYSCDHSSASHSTPLRWSTGQFDLNTWPIWVA